MQRADVPSEASATRPLVLLLAGDVGAAWTRALEGFGMEVSAPAWLDGISAARLRRPALVLVSSDLPEGAVTSVINGFRSGTGVHDLPILVAGPGAAQLDRETGGPYRADHYLATANPFVLARDVQELIRTGQLRPRLRHPWIVAASLSVAGLAFAGSLTASILRKTGRLGWLQSVQPALMPVVALGFVAAALAGSRRPDGRLSIAQWRSALLWLGLMLGQLGGVFGRLEPVDSVARSAASAAAFTLAFAAWAAWAWLGPRAKQRTTRVARAFQIFAGVLLAAGVVPWFFVS